MDQDQKNPKGVLLQITNMSDRPGVLVLKVDLGIKNGIEAQSLVGCLINVIKQIETRCKDCSTCEFKESCDKVNDDISKHTPEEAAQLVKDILGLVKGR